MSIIKDAKISFRSGNTVIQLIVINVVVFLAVLAVRLGLLISLGKVDYQMSFDKFIGWFAMPYALARIAYPPVYTYNAFLSSCRPFPPAV
ncbi:MAG: hypothetical protein M0D57_12430 [Sphingobacteriales bacterium JAD_PAG50586_3]|nr:MAG: hypothetical protein M0D57_12430 [Sphingobacteriales bacterium JAD_PAG50586_3]